MATGRRRGAYTRHVTAVFPGRALAFDWPEEATLEDLVECLAFLGGSEGGVPISVDVRFDG